ncbi:hypothetical protein A2382_02365 [Candidatus Woesebacteria bacterium RIFOXYB1_FULL_38_16]|uniref:Homing endonuclease LAGLIDADG domain-containing protein n=1 Tax=Candidatus Woesebacteria bacterium RIFOXYB1_FULL_38_16 TaxID=1802538 RepID=A0A1F8CRG2_9BACT|nr:MAG: hypothetical protein A2191_04530 [Candidatus Woesebacteria bacterium RIFOXYA1_FULL_38_9]OGM78872.1 MAG: hypothetical protein A2382_02365 [Candidatus Woesebacteria bacterium RIFOXYB1_FULL_38_16]
MTSQQRAYLAGFLDCDGSIMLQLRARNDVRFKYRVKTTICFYQKTKHKLVLEELKNIIGFGYVYDRSDGMTELRIEGHARVKSVLTKLRRYLKIKYLQANLMLKAVKYQETNIKTPEGLLQISKIADKISSLNNAPRQRKNHYSSVKADLISHGLMSP